MFDFVPNYFPTYIFLAFAVLVWFITMIIIAKSLRVVVGTNDVHVVQSTKQTISYGKGQIAGNTYYKWPSWIPGFGVQVTKLPVSVFSLSLKDYPGYDIGRVPFLIDIIGFFRISAPNMAAERLASFEDLKSQLNGILQGAIRSILAGSEIEAILGGRAAFGTAFTEAVDHQLENWGVQSVKTIELMDIRDAQGSKVIENIMAKKKSFIDMESRTAVAANGQKARIAEVEAGRQVGIAEQEAAEQVGTRTAEKDKTVGIANQKAEQAVKLEMVETATKTMAVTQVNEVRAAEIAKQVAVVQAQQQRDVNVTQAEGTKQQTITIAEGGLESKKREAEGNLAVGTAKAESDRLLLMAPVSAQIALAEKIGSDEGYQKYLVTVRNIEASQAVGIEQAKALEKAQVKVFANSGGVVDGVKGVMDMFSAKGGLSLGAALEGLASTDAGRAVVDKLKSSNGSGTHA